MKIEMVQIKDMSSGKYFVFIKHFTGICAQGDTKQEATEKVKSYFDAYIKRMDASKKIYSEQEFAMS